ncbi:phage gp6-like head-tail connector protein [Sutcliffiella horikoshii]|uniref:phage gp6-like head-tail connector protein n=1 Tax=Sutcliffiella horikoshii TaxID=79883 RepID=UPI003CF020A0
MEVTDQLLQEFKERMHISHDEDNNLKRLLSFSMAYVKSKVKNIDIETNLQAKELVIERTRYAYNDTLEYFENNFISQINSLILEAAMDEMEENEDATI